MAIAIYAIERSLEGWVIRHDGDVSSAYETVGAAFETTCSAAALALKQGMEVAVTVDRALRAAHELAVEPKGEAMLRMENGQRFWSQADQRRPG